MFDHDYRTGSIWWSERLREIHQLAPEATPGIAMLDAGTVIRSSPVDGVHFEAAEHAKLGRAVAAKVRELFA